MSGSCAGGLRSLMSPRIQQNCVSISLLYASHLARQRENRTTQRYEMQNSALMGIARKGTHQLHLTTTPRDGPLARLKASRPATNILLLRGSRSRSAELVKSRRQIRGDRIRIAAFDLVALEHEGDLAVAHQGNRRRRRPVAREVAPGALGCVRVLACEDCRQHVRTRCILQRHRDRWARLA